MLTIVLGEGKSFIDMVSNLSGVFASTRVLIRILVWIGAVGPIMKKLLLLFRLCLDKCDLVSLSEAIILKKLSLTCSVLSYTLRLHVCLKASGPPANVKYRRAKKRQNMATISDVILKPTASTANAP